MRRRLLLLAAAIGLIFGPAATAVLACGDKFIVSTRARRHTSGPAKPATLLVYRNTTAPANNAIHESGLQKALESVGHKVTIVGTLPEMDEAVKLTRFDVILTNEQDADSVKDIVRFASKRPAVLPVAYKASKVEMEQLKKKYHCGLNSPSQRSDILAAVDDAVSSRSR